MAVPLTVADIARFIDERWSARIKEDWDSVGLIAGDPDAPVTKILLAVDPVMPVIDEAVRRGADMIVTHHPLLLKGVHSVAAVDHKGRIVHTLISNGIALLNAHTNADHGIRGVSDALALRLGLVDLRPIVQMSQEVGIGTGRVGELPRPVPLQTLAEQVARVLPATHHGVRVAGDPEAMVRTVAVCGGSGGSLLAEASRVADVYITADLRHHIAQDHLMDGGCALIDVSHWASEWPWLEYAAEALVADAAGRGSTVEVHVSTTPTDPWSLHLGSPL